MRPPLVAPNAGPATSQQTLIRRYLGLSRLLAYGGGAFGLLGILVFATGSSWFGLSAPSLPLNSIAFVLIAWAVLDMRPFENSRAVVACGLVACGLTLSKQLAMLGGLIVSPVLVGNAVMVCLLGLALIFQGSGRTVQAQLAAGLGALPPLIAIISVVYQTPGCPSLAALIVYVGGLLLAGAILGQTSYRGPLRHLLATSVAGHLSRTRIAILAAAAVGLGYAASRLHYDPVSVPLIVTMTLALIVIVMTDIAGYALIRRTAPSPVTGIRELTELEIAIDRALDRREFHLVYQPQVGLPTGALLGVEALIRWRDPEKGLVTPADFIPAAEATGQIEAIGLWVLEEACADVVRWKDPALVAVKLSVNVSPVQLVFADFATKVRAILERTGFPAPRLVLELTESGLVQRGNPGFAALWELHQLGVGIAIDDFGTGYSCLAYLRDLPVSYLKIDRSFVNDLPLHEGSAVIARTIVAMGHGLGLIVIAEGVETDAQAEFLRGIRCDEAQGFRFGPPMEAAVLLGLAAGAGKFTV